MDGDINILLREEATGCERAIHFGIQVRSSIPVSVGKMDKYYIGDGRFRTKWRYHRIYRIQRKESGELGVELRRNAGVRGLDSCISLQTQGVGAALNKGNYIIAGETLPRSSVGSLLLQKVLFLTLFVLSSTWQVRLSYGKRESYSMYFFLKPK